MAEHLARIHGTEEDKVNCPFYFKIGACRHGDRCSRIHHKPNFSTTLLIKHIYRHPVRVAEAMGNTNNNNNNAIEDKKSLDDFLDFFEDMYLEFGKYGQIDQMHVCDNLGDHMVGHVYVKFFNEEDASDALEAMNGRYYDGRKMEIEFSPVTDFREARCRDYDEDICARAGFCNFMHSKPVPMFLLRSLDEDLEPVLQEKNKNSGGKSSSSSKSSRDKEDKDKRRARKRDRRDRREHDERRERKRSRKSSSSRSRRSRSRSPDGSDGGDSRSDGDNDSGSE